MNIAKNSLFNKVCAILVIIALTISDFLFIGTSAVSYAVDMVKTNSSNVDFSAYFLNENGEKLEKLEKNIDMEEEYLYVDVSVKNEGYFNGTIKLNDSNFNLKQEILSPEISEIKGNEVHLNQINAGSTVTIKLGIEAPKDVLITNTTLDTKTVVELSGQYVNSKNVEKDKYITIEGKTDVQIAWKSSENTNIELNTEVLTNSVYQVESAKKNVVQLLVKSRITNNNYPVKNTELNVTVPENVQDVKVHTRTNAATNSSIDFGAENYTYNKATNILTINIKNEDENNISWNRNALDAFVITYVFDGETEITNKDIKVTGLINTYDGKELTASQDVHIKDNIDGIISYEIRNLENSIYKGKLYTGEERTYQEAAIINVDYLNVANSITLAGENATFMAGQEEKNANIVYKETKINLADFIKIFGEDGTLSITDNNGIVIANINKDTETDENGNIIINYLDGTKNIVVSTSKPVNTGRFVINNKKAILNSGYERTQIDQLTAIKEKISAKYNDNIATQKETTMELKNTSSKALLNVGVNTLSAVDKNENVKITAVLLNSDESKDLYQNPTLKITLPEQVTGVSDVKIQLLYEKELTINKDNSKIYKENGKNVIEVDLSGTQTLYNTETLEGTTVIVYATLEVDKKAKSGDEQITLNYTNELATTYEDAGEVKVPVKIYVPEISEEDAEKQNELTEDTQDSVITEEGINIESQIQAYIGGTKINPGDEIRAGEVIKYEVSMKNTGNQTVNNINLNLTIPEGTSLVVNNPEYPKSHDESSASIDENDESKQMTGREMFENSGEYQYLLEGDYLITKEDKSLREENITIEAGKTYKYAFMLVVNTDLKENKDIEAVVSIKKNDTEINSVKMSNKIIPADIKVSLKPLYRKYGSELEAGQNYVYMMEISNLSDKEQKNIKVTINRNKSISINSISWYINENEVSDENSQGMVDVNEKTFTINSIPANKTASVVINASIVQESNNIEMASMSGIIKDSNGNSYRANLVSEKVVGVKIDAFAEAEVTPEDKEKFINVGTKIKYTITIKNTGYKDAESISIDDEFSNYLNLSEVKINGENCDYTEDTIIDDNNSYKSIKIESQLASGKEATIEIIGEVDSNLPTDRALEVINKATIYNAGVQIAETQEIIYNIEAITDEDEGNNNQGNNNQGNNNNDNTGNNGNNNNDNNDNPQDNTYTVSGAAWLDSNQNGQREINEPLLGGIDVILLNLDTKQGIRVTTSDDGTYIVKNVKNGNYIAIFEYDTEKYMLTKYQVEGVNPNRNSDVENVTMNIDGQSKKVASTNALTVNGRSIANIDIGLVEAKSFDMELSKSITKITVTNKAGTKTTNYDNAQLAKAEVKAKHLSGTTVVIEYKIKITNNGELAGYAKNIVDYKPTDLNFNSELNPNWYQSGNNLYTKSLANTKIEPGESKELTLILTKTMTTSNTGLTNNMAEIAEDYNSSGIADTDSTPGNKNIQEDDIGQANVIISVSTGAAISYLTLTLSIIIVLAAGAYIISKKVLQENIKF